MQNIQIDLAEADVLDKELAKGAKISICVIRLFHLVERFRLGIQAGVYKLNRYEDGCGSVEMTEEYLNK